MDSEKASASNLQSTTPAVSLKVCWKLPYLSMSQLSDLEKNNTQPLVLIEQSVEPLDIADAGLMATDTPPGSLILDDVCKKLIALDIEACKDSE